MDDKKDITIVDTNGKVLQTGTQGLRILSEDGVHLLDVSEVSDDTVINIFFRMNEARSFNSTPTSAEQGRLPEKFEFLIPRVEGRSDRGTSS